MFVTPNAFTGTDADRINQAVAVAVQANGHVVIPRLNRAADGTRDYWLLDSAIQLPSHVTLELNHCRIKLADTCRDNLIRSANCGMGITDIRPLEDIHIVGVGNATLEGADRPRSTGDGGEKLGPTDYRARETVRGVSDGAPAWIGGETFGTDAGVAGESQTGDWRNIGVLLASVRNFSIRNLGIKGSHGWAISLERCAHGRLSRIDFDSVERREIDGITRHMHNLDGIDLRQGCHDILIEDITGHTGDDLVALTAIPYPTDFHGGAGRIGGRFCAMVSDMTDPGDGSDDIRHITVRNIRGYCAGGHHVVRLLNTRGLGLHDVLIDGVMDTSPGAPCRATVRIGDGDPAYGGVTPMGMTRRILVRNIHSRGRHGVLIAGSLCDSIVEGVVHRGGQAVTVEQGEHALRNVTVEHVVTGAEM